MGDCWNKLDILTIYQFKKITKKLWTSKVWDKLKFLWNTDTFVHLTSLLGGLFCKTPTQKKVLKKQRWKQDITNWWKFSSFSDEFHIVLCKITQKGGNIQKTCFQPPEVQLFSVYQKAWNVDQKFLIVIQLQIQLPSSGVPNLRPAISWAISSGPRLTLKMVK